ncbi:DUF3592 domain-containing protein [Kribbella sp. VKM Ac-2568]|uniref:DUF3592 domain-containing protein n=1 Tax=Kribbella sp. VKM Ac-2568 TaxID=2512219 RepID=UPI0010D8340B|nr:DUF3592 domain-containing protein [Kribbella sp. VKM Ac-2568]TCM47122.1 hypothetical protein EV648_105603 [Kribbella sp. VKM Ac-2568]
MLTIVVFGGFGLVLLVTACIVADVVAGVRRSGDGVEKTAGRVTRVRGPVRGQLDSGTTAECLEITVEYYTRHGEGPFEVQRMIPLASASRYAKDDRVIVSYDIRAPRRARIAGKVSHWPQFGPRSPVPLP